MLWPSPSSVKQTSPARTVVTVPLSLYSPSPEIMRKVSPSPSWMCQPISQFFSSLTTLKMRPLPYMPSAGRMTRLMR